MSDYPRSSEVEIFHQDVFWKELLVEKKECNEKMLNLRRKRVAGEREDEVLVMKKKLQEIVECLKGREELLRKDEEFDFEGRMKEWLKKSGEKEKYGGDHWKWHDSGGLVLGANETREFIIGSLGATRKGGGVEMGMTQEWHLL